MIAFFDVDGTLLKGFSGYEATLYLLRKKILKKRRLPIALFYKVISPFFRGNIQKLYEIAAKDMAGRTLDEILAIGRECFEKKLKPNFFTDVIAILKAHQAKGDYVGLITSGPYMVIKFIADHLQVNEFYCAGPIVEDGRLTSKIHLPIYYKEGKIAAAEEVLKKMGQSWKDCLFYTDSIDDVPLLMKVGSPYLVNPDPALKKMGQQKGWPMITTHKTEGGL